MITLTSLKIAYIGGGSRDWARKLMIDLALCPDLWGEATLYDIDSDSENLNKRLGKWLQDQPGAVSKWHCATIATLKETLQRADFASFSSQAGSLALMAEETAPQKTLDLLAGVTQLTLEPSGETSIDISKALLGLDDLLTNVNTENIGQISNMPLHNGIETNVCFNCDEVQPLSAGALPDGTAPIVNQHGANQELVVEAALTENNDLAFQAFFNDLGHHLCLDAAWEFFKKLLQLNAAHLPATAVT